MEVLPQQSENFQMTEDTSDEEDDIAIVTKKKKNFNRSFLSDDEDDLEDLKSPEDGRVDATLKEDSDDDEIIERNAKGKVKKRRIAIQDESDEESENEYMTPEVKKTVNLDEDGNSSSDEIQVKSNNSKVDHEEEDDDESSVESTGETEDEEEHDESPVRIFRSQHPPSNEGMRGLEADDDIYDNEMDDDLPPVGADEIAEPSEGRRSSRRRDTLIDIKSETQRLIRETPINLPYHVPDEDKLTQLLRLPFMKQEETVEEVRDTISPQKEKETIENDDNGNDESNKVEHFDDQLPDISINNTKVQSDKESEDKKDNNVTCDSPSDEISTSEHEQEKTNKENPALSKKFKLLEKYGIKLPNLPASNVSPLTRKPEIVNLDEDEEQTATPKNTGVASLMQRFLKQTSAKKTPKTNEKVKINIVRKELREDGSGVELVSDTVTTTKEQEDDVVATQHVTPGEKLLLLRKQLSKKMRLKREVERKKREELYKLDNEELGSEREEDEIDEDFEVSDEESGGSDQEEELPDTEPVVPGEEFDEASDTNGSFHEEEAHNNTLRANNGVIDDSDESDGNDVEDGNETEEANNEEKSVPNRSMVSESCGSLPRFTSDNSVLLFDESTRSSSISNIGKHPATTALDRTCSDDSFYASLIPGHQPENSSISSVSFNKPQTSKTGDFDDCDFEETSQPFHFDFEASQSQLLDADGLMRQEDSNELKAKIPTNDVSISALPLGAEDDNAKDGNISELLQLCSGQFQDNTIRNSEKDNLTNTQELIALCSGKFTETKDTSKVSDGASAMQSHVHDVSDVQHSDSQRSTQPITEADKSFGFNVQPNSPTNIPDFKSAFAEDADNESESDNEEAMMIVRKKRHKKCGKRRRRLAEFVEKEAELSGSDLGSADEEEADSLEDEYEEDEITEQLPDDEAIKQQVGKFHLRQVMNEEEEEIELLKEAFAEPKQFNRDRKFKWKNIDSDLTQNLFKCDSSEEDEAESMEAVPIDTMPAFTEDSQWRRDRLEREEFLKNKQKPQQPNNIEGLIEEDSQFLQLGAKCVRKNSEASMEPPKLCSEDSISRDGFRKVRKGSFLTRSKETLSRLANFQDLKNAKGPSNSNRMVFKAVSPSVSESKKLGRRRKMQNENLPPAKRVHVDEDSNSIFDLFQ